MRLPQDRILHIDSELAGDEVRVVAEWQGELVRCKDCKHYSVIGEITRFGWCGYWNRSTDEMRYCSDGERREP